jgi:hypothetical protein
MDSGRQPQSSRYASDQTRPWADVGLLGAATEAAMVQEFKYLPTGEWTEASRPILRPALDVKLFDKAGRTVANARALIDSGADFVTFSTDWAELLGIDVRTDCAPLTATVADGRLSMRYAYTEGLEVEFAGERVFLPVVLFCQDMPVPLLGRRGFFDRFLVLIDQPNLRFFLEPSTVVEDDDDPGDGAEPDTALALD